MRLDGSSFDECSLDGLHRVVQSMGVQVGHLFRHTLDEEPVELAAQLVERMNVGQIVLGFVQPRIEARGHAVLVPRTSLLVVPPRRGAESLSPCKLL